MKQISRLSFLFTDGQSDFRSDFTDGVLGQIPQRKNSGSELRLCQFAQKIRLVAGAVNAFAQHKLGRDCFSFRA